MNRKLGRMGHQNKKHSQTKFLQRTSRRIKSKLLFAWWNFDYRLLSMTFLPIGPCFLLGLLVAVFG